MKIAARFETLLDNSFEDMLNLLYRSIETGEATINASQDRKLRSTNPPTKIESNKKEGDMPEGMGRIGLQETIAALRKELIDSIVSAQGEELRFEVGEVKLEFQIEVERSATAKGGIKFWVAEMGVDGAVKNKDTHKITIPLKPVRRDGKPLLTGSDDDVE